MKALSVNHLPLLTAALLLAAPPAFAEERVCRGTIGRITLDNVRVPNGAICRLNGTFVKGTVKVQGNAQLYANDVMVIGNIQGEGARYVSVFNTSRVGGSVQVKQGGGGYIADSRVDGSAQFESNRTPNLNRKTVRILRSRIDEDVQAFQNRRGVEISRNTIDGNLQCKENNPRPVGGRNIVGGNKEDQCARL
jgi:hypothetical protein